MCAFALLSYALLVHPSATAQSTHLKNKHKHKTQRHFETSSILKQETIAPIPSMALLYTRSCRLLLVASLVAGFCCHFTAEGLAAKAKGKKSLASGGAKGFGASKQPVFTHTTDTSVTTQALTKFLTAQKSMGVEQGVVEIGFQENSQQRGLFATTNIKKGQVVCMIPSDLALALSDPAKFGEDAPTWAHGGRNFLSMYWNDATARSMWSPYLDTLPTRESPCFTATPDFFSDEEIELLEFPRLINNVRKRKADIAQLAQEDGLDYDELQFATWLVSSRAFNVNLSENDNGGGEQDEEIQYDDRGQVITKAGKGLKSIRVLVPFLDMVNGESSSPNCRFTMIDPKKDEAWFALEANRPISAGKEITISYRSGIYSSVELLLNYGFVPKENKVDNFMLKKGGEGAITSLDGWTTTLEEDQTMAKMMEGEEDSPLKKILAFRTKLKESYGGSDGGDAEK